MTALATKGRDPGVPPVLWERVAHAPERLLLVDFDGTLASLRADRRRAVPLPACRAALARLAATSTRVVVVSGRPVAELRRLLGRLPVALVGEHGWEQWWPGKGLRRHRPPAGTRAELRRSAASAIRLGLGRRIEIKRYSIVLHTRGLGAAAARAALATARQAWQPAADGAGLRLEPIDGGLELRTAGRDKGTAVAALLASSPAALPVYIGDDRTDEDAFRVVAPTGFALRVGRDDRPTSAQGRLESVAAVARFLRAWLRRTADDRSPAAGRSGR